MFKPVSPVMIRVLWAALLFCGIVLVYTGVLENGFVNLDDDAYVLDNPHVNTGLNPENMRWAITAFHSANWHPLTWLSHQLDVTLFGLEPSGHHLVNVLIHALNGVLLFLFLILATGSAWRSLLVAAFFSFHPLRVESVAWIAERKDVLAACFFLAALCAYAAYARKRSAPRYVLVTICFTMSLLAKPMWVTFPCLALLLDFWPLRRLEQPSCRWLLVVEKAPWFVLAGGVSVLATLAQKSAGALMAVEVLGPVARVGNTAIAYVEYLIRLFAPGAMAVPYPLDVSRITPARVGLSVALLAIVTVLVLWQLRRRPALAIGWFWFIGTLVPVIGLVQIGAQASADRYTYLTQAGLLVALVWGLWPQRADPDLDAPRARWTAWITAPALALLLSLCIISTVRQVRVWRDSETLFRHTLAVTFENSIAHNNLGKALLNRYVEARVAAENAGGEVGSTHLPLLDEAEANFDAAIHAGPGNFEAYSNRAACLMFEGRLGAAEEAYEDLLETRRDDPGLFVNYGVVLFRQDRFEEARLAALSALSLEPGFGPALELLGFVDLKQKQ